ncbi:hypothetical protein [Clostridium tarantellae]|uniref:Uncharacterized protein n=1 Tax=Clostridium tarantellae TaxID=39493 RepID=A0A6I1MS19_9CLOT|nr:hypothetical protein [Clostridium tarantellae]MPQ45258.1 hypothetical protein [Clostridium tarantellae]
MNKLFEINEIDFYQEEFQDNIFEFEDIIPLIQDFQSEMKLEKIECVDLNDCCGKTKTNFLAELVGVIDKEDNFYTINEAIELLPLNIKDEFLRKLKKDENSISLLEKLIKKTNGILVPFVIQIYKCLGCNKWIINIIE